MKTVVVDGIASLYASFLEYGTEGAEAGVVRHLGDLREGFADQTLLILWGSMVNPDRKGEWPEYGRRGVDFGAFGLDEAMRSLKDGLTALGMAQFSSEKGEPLDVFASAEEAIERPAVVETSDRRFLCLIDDDLAVKLPDEGVFDRSSIRSEMGADPDTLEVRFALEGDQTLGIPGVGLSRFVKDRLLREAETPAELFEGDFPHLSPSDQVELANHEPQFELNRRLIRPLDVDYRHIPGEYDESGASDYLDSLGDTDLQEYDFSEASGFTKYS